MNKQTELSSQEIIEQARKVIRIEASALAALETSINDSFVKAIQLILRSTGRVIIAGVGKSGLVGRKIVATLNSTGTPSLFMHPSDAVHGDLGMVRKEDVILLISKSGVTEELIHLFPLLKRIGVKIISFVGNMNSYLARESDVPIDISVPEEACPHDLAPTASTTATLAMGDALAVALIVCKNFTKDDFAAFHPGGMLGKKLMMRINEIMVQGENIPIVRDTIPLSDAIVEISKKRLGATCVVNSEGTLLGIITDGDLRRYLQKHSDISAVMARDAMTVNPKTITGNVLAVTALEVMENYSITQLVIVNEQNVPIGMIHLHDLVKQGFGQNA